MSFPVKRRTRNVHATELDLWPNYLELPYAEATIRNRTIFSIIKAVRNKLRKGIQIILEELAYSYMFALPPLKQYLRKKKTRVSTFLCYSAEFIKKLFEKEIRLNSN